MADGGADTTGGAEKTGGADTSRGADTSALDAAMGAATSGNDVATRKATSANDAMGAATNGNDVAAATATRLGRRRLLLGLGVGLALGGGAGFESGRRYAQRGTARAERPPAKPAYVELAAHNLRRGPDAAKVTVVAFTDFECPFCARAKVTLDALFAAYPNDLAIVLKHRPLAMHKNAELAAVAVQAAARAGQGWAMHDLLFENRKTLGRADLAGFAARLGLDATTFEASLSDKALLEEVRADVAVADAIGATGTPSFYVNGHPLRGAQPLGEFRKLVDAELVEANKLVAAGVPLAEIYARRSRAVALGG